VPYAAGVMEVEAGKDLPSIDEITWWYSSDLFRVESFAERSKMMLNSFLRDIEFLVINNKYSTIDSHNLARFDGLLLISLMLENAPEWVVKPE